MGSNTSNNFSSFLETYKTRNIADNSSVLEYHLIEMENLSKEMTQDIEDKSLKSLFEKLSESIPKEANYQNFKVLLVAGSVLNHIIDHAKRQENNNILHDNRFKNIVTHFFEIAKALEDKQLIQLAIKIGKAY